MHVELHQNKFISLERYTFYTGFECDGPKWYPFVVVDYAVIYFTHYFILSVLEIIAVFSKVIFNGNFGKKQVNLFCV